MCACEDTFVCPRCTGTPDDPAYLEAPDEPDSRPEPGEVSE